MFLGLTIQQCRWYILIYCLKTNLLQVFKQRMYIRMYGAESCKPTLLWSNSSMVLELDLGPIPKEPWLNVIYSTRG